MVYLHNLQIKWWHNQFKFQVFKFQSFSLFFKWNQSQILYLLIIITWSLYFCNLLPSSNVSTIGYNWLLISIDVEFPFVLWPFWADNSGVISARSRYGRTRDCLRSLATKVRALCDIISFQYITVDKYYTLINIINRFFIRKIPCLIYHER